MTSPFLPPYPYRLINRGQVKAYEFNTAHGLTYEITFTSGDYFPASPLREYGIILGLELLDPLARDPGTDARIEATVIAAIEQVLAAADPIIVWVCSPEKKQQRARNLLFNRWYQHYKQTGPYQLIKQDVQPTAGQFVSLLYRADNPERGALEELLLEDLDKL